MVVLAALYCMTSSVVAHYTRPSPYPSQSGSMDTELSFTKRKALLCSSSLMLSGLSWFKSNSALALQVDELQQQEERIVELFQVFILSSCRLWYCAMRHHNENGIFVVSFKCALNSAEIMVEFELLYDMIINALIMF